MRFESVRFAAACVIAAAFLTPPPCSISELTNTAVRATLMLGGMVFKPLSPGADGRYAPPPHIPQFLSSCSTPPRQPSNSRQLCCQCRFGRLHPSNVCGSGPENAAAHNWQTSGPDDCEEKGQKVDFPWISRLERFGIPLREIHFTKPCGSESGVISRIFGY
jgi:hypothetical protein